MENDESQNLQRDVVHVSFASALVAQARECEVVSARPRSRGFWQTGEVHEGEDLVTLCESARIIISYRQV